MAGVPQPWLLGLTAMLLLGPKVIALMWLGIDRDLRAALGGGAPVVTTIAIEVLLSMLVAPIIMLGQTVAIVDILCGRPSGWIAQRREADGLPAMAALSLYGWHIGFGAIFLLAMIGGFADALWTLPVTIGLLAAPFTAMLVSRRDVGDWLSNRGLFVSPTPFGPDKRRVASPRPSDRLDEGVLAER